jgi:hypothetical protein
MQSLPSSRAITALSHIQQQLQASLCETLSNAFSNVRSLGRQVLEAAPTAAEGQRISGGLSLTHGPQFDSHHQHRVPIPSSSRILVETLTSPKISPPYPLNQILKSQAKGQVQDMLYGLVTAATVKMEVGPLTC